MSFACQRCGACCLQPGVVLLELADIKRLAEGLGMGVGTFDRTYVTEEKVALALGGDFEAHRFLDNRAGGCAFLAEVAAGRYRCVVWPNRPEQCRTFPTWGGTAYHSPVEDSCPGVGKTE